MGNIAGFFKDFQKIIRLEQLIVALSLKKRRQNCSNPLDLYNSTIRAILEQF
jgi:hypothetical protein